MFYFGGSLPPEMTHVVQMSVKRSGWDFTILCTPKTPSKQHKAKWVNANRKLTDVYRDIYIPVKVRLINKLLICYVNIHDKVFKLNENDHQSLYLPYGGACIVLVMC